MSAPGICSRHCRDRGCTDSETGRTTQDPPEDAPVLVVDHPRAVLGSVAATIYGDPSRHLGVVGVTGTAGKTTTCYLLEAALAADGSTTGLIGTVETRIGGEVAPIRVSTAPISPVVEPSAANAASSR